MMKLGTLCKRFSSGDRIDSQKINEYGKYPVFGGNGIRGYTEEYNFDGRCAIIGRQGAKCGNVRYFEGKAYMTEHAIVVQANDQNDIGYLAYRMSLMDLGKYQGQSAQPGLSVKNLIELPIEVPDLHTQVKIWNVLEGLENKIQNNSKINNNLEEQIELIYNYWFNQYNFISTENRPYKLSGGLLEWNDEIKRNIPNSWQVKSLLDIVDWESNSQPPKSQFIYEYKEGYVRFIQNRDYDSNSYITYIPFKKSLTTVSKLDILIDKYGDAGKVRYGIEGVFNVALAKIKPKNSKYLEYVRSYLNSKEIYTYLHNSCMASTRASLSEENLKSLKIVIPNDEILNDFQNRITTMRKLILSNHEENNKLIELKNFLLPMLMNGQIDVEDIEI